MNFSVYFEHAGAMGWSERQVDECSLWGFANLRNGHRKSLGEEPKAPPPSVDDFEAAVARLEG